jgi:hypothetical protein
MSNRLTVKNINRIIQEEKKKLEKEGLISSETTDDAWAGGKNLVHKIDYVKKLEIKERKLRKKAEVYKRLRLKLENSISRSS